MGLEEGTSCMLVLSLTIPSLEGMGRESDQQQVLSPNSLMQPLQPIPMFLLNWGFSGRQLLV